ncbi:hypothetical protein XU18_4404 [Perkinsela sp. CCAP 1560/4]|nr:hypothetical protein XU18_4404 [Perkinsela sp. CCAP 1560/4]|eukprot:KNH04314.1 hypothetical protein XU18_4404 [Perkinsela sp. CCAP 1560/4]
MFHTKERISVGDLVLAYTGFGYLHPIYVTVEDADKPSTAIRGIRVIHKDIVGMRYGAEISYDKFLRKRRSTDCDILEAVDTQSSKELKSKKSPLIKIYLLRPTPSLISKMLPRYTQIIFPEDMAAICSELKVIPGSYVLESGTGSGSLTHRFALSILPHGHLTTVEFHATRHIKIAEMLEKHGLSPHPVTLLSGDVSCASTTNALISSSYDCVFLDIPNPWDFLKNGQHRLLKTGGSFASFSPCIEQVQKTVHWLSKIGTFTNIRTIEVRSRWYNALSNRDDTTGKHGDNSGIVNSRPHKGCGLLPNDTGYGHTAYITFALCMQTGGCEVEENAGISQ